MREILEPVGKAKKGNWKENDKPDGTYLFVMEVGGVGWRAALASGTFTFMCKRCTK